MTFQLKWLQSIMMTVLVWSLGSMVPAAGFGQNLIEAEGSATVPIVNEDLSAAQDKAVFEAKKALLRDVLLEILNAEDISDPSDSIQTRILNQPDRFFESVRIKASTPLPETQELSVTLAARVFRNQLQGAVSQLNLGKTTNPTRRLILIQDQADSIWKGDVKPAFLRSLNRHLGAYKAHIPQTVGLANAWFKSQNQQIPAAIVANHQSSGFLVLDFEPNQVPRNTVGAFPLKLTMMIFSGDGQKRLGKSETTLELENWTSRESLEALLNKASVEWRPAMRTWLAEAQKQGAPIEIELVGNLGPQQESEFVQQGFVNSPAWKQFQIYRLSAEASHYRGFFDGSESEVRVWLQSIEVPGYAIRAVTPVGQHYRVQVQWTEQAQLLSSYAPIPVVESWLADHTFPTPNYRTPPDKVDQVFELPESEPIYDFLRSRGDSTQFKISWIAPGSSISGQWHQIEESNLHTMISIYDAEHQLIRRFSSRPNNAVTFDYQVPSDQTHFYIRVADEIGHVPRESGSYRQSHYLLMVNRVP